MWSTRLYLQFLWNFILDGIQGCCLHQRLISYNFTVTIGTKHRKTSQKRLRNSLISCWCFQKSLSLHKGKQLQSCFYFKDTEVVHSGILILSLMFAKEDKLPKMQCVMSQSLLYNILWRQQIGHMVLA
jgi:hypothetical protein